MPKKSTEDKRLLTLDVGCGGSYIGDVNVDLLVPDSCMSWDQNPTGIKNFVKADIRYLPFKDGSFFFVYCSHLVEHLVNEWEGINELKRVSRKYVAIFVPHAFLSSLCNPFFHLWKYGEAMRWLKRNHLHYWNNDPFKTGSWKLSRMPYKNLWNRKNKFKVILSKIIPIQTYTLWDVSN